MTSFLIFTGIAVMAHFLAWAWRPWFPGVNGYGAVEVAHNVVSMLS
jgi:light-harvesting complex 1 beta chain